jgi:DoxX-like protein
MRACLGTWPITFASMGSVIGALRALPAVSNRALVIPLLPPFWLIRIAVAAVWLYEGLWCKLLGREPRQLQIVETVPRCGPRVGARFLKTLGVVEVALALWALTGALSIPCAAVQTVLLVALNAAGLLWARALIHDPAGMVIKNFAFLVLVWVSASLPA